MVKIAISKIKYVQIEKRFTKKELEDFYNSKPNSNERETARIKVLERRRVLRDLFIKKYGTVPKQLKF